MRKRVVFLAALGFIATAAMLLTADPVLAQRGGGGRGGGGGGGRGFSGGGGRSFSSGGGAFRTSGFSAGARSFSTAGVRPATGAYYSGYRGVTSAYGAYRGYGYGAYRPYYSAFRGYYHNYYRNYFPYYFPFAFGFYFPYYGGVGYYPSYDAGQGTYDGGYVPPVASDSQVPPSTDRPPPDDAAHLQLTVPENAEVIIDGNKTIQTGTVREFVSPTLKAGTTYSYRITVRYPDATGKAVEDTRDIRFTANDWFAIDFTRPPPAPTAPPPKIVPKGKE